MKGIRQMAFKRLLFTSFVSALALIAFVARPASAEFLSLPSVLTSEPISLAEKVIGPIFPKGGIGGTFRSEFGGGFEIGSLLAASLTASEGFELDLRRVMPLEHASNLYSLYGNLRLWRFGLRAGYWNFDNRSKAKNQGKYDLSGGRIGVDFDVVQFQYLALGVGADHYYIQPRLEGRVVVSADDPSGFNILMTGDNPRTVGPYLRFVPAEILGFPLHLEAFWKLPISSTKLMSYGFALCFRPQLYRFDASMKLGIKRMHCKFKAEPTLIGLDIPVRSDTWTLDNEWELYSLDLSLYF